MTTKKPSELRPDRKGWFKPYIAGTWQLYLMMLVPIVYIICFKYKPMLGIVMAFKKYTPFGGRSMWEMDWVGFQWFEEAFRDSLFWKSLGNTLILNLKNAGIVIPDDWDLSVLACPTPASMPTSETAANSGHATVTIEGTAITITLDCKVADLANANHGETWGVHKWLGFGVRTGLGSIVGVQFTDDTGASATLAADDASEALGLGLSAGDFVLYIKAEQKEYLTGEKSFTLKTDGYAETTFTMQIVGAEDAEEA